MLKKICQTMFKQHKRAITIINKNKRIGKVPAGVASELLKGKHARLVRKKPAVLELENKKKQKTKTQNPFKTMINVASMFAGKQHVPVTTSLLLTNEGDNQLGVKATDLESWFSGIFQYSENAMVNENSRICVDTKEIKKIVSNLNGIANIKLTDKGISVNDYFVSPSMDAKDFPAIPEVTDINAYNLPDLGNKLIFVSQPLHSDTSYSNGIYLDLERGALVANDGRRLHVAPMESKRNPEYENETKGVIFKYEILKLAKLLNGRLTLLKKNHEEKYNRIVFSLKIPGYVSTMLIEGQYPKYTEVIPKQFCGKLTVERKEMDMILQRAIAVTTPEWKCARFEFGQKVRISIAREDTGRLAFCTDFKTAKYNGPSFVGGLNPCFLFEAIHNMPDNVIEISLPQNNGAWVIQGPQPKYVAVIMPMNLKD